MLKQWLRVLSRLTTQVLGPWAIMLMLGNSAARIMLSDGLAAHREERWISGRSDESEPNSQSRCRYLSPLKEAVVAKFRERFAGVIIVRKKLSKKSKADLSAAPS